MENPHEQTQNALLSRIINNMETLNESIVAMNKALHDINRKNMDLELVSQMWDNYSSISKNNLETTGEKREPI